METCVAKEAKRESWELVSRDNAWEQLTVAGRSVIHRGPTRSWCRCTPAHSPPSESKTEPICRRDRGPSSGRCYTALAQHPNDLLRNDLPSPSRDCPHNSVFVAIGGNCWRGTPKACHSTLRSVQAVHQGARTRSEHRCLRRRKHDDSNTQVRRADLRRV